MLTKNNGALLWNSWFNVQNIGTDVTTVSVKYSDITAPVVRTINPGASSRFDQSLESHPTKIFGAEVTSTSTTPQNLAVTVINETATAIFAYSGFAGTSKNPVLPMVNYQPVSTKGWTTGISVQNTSDTTSSNITISYTPAPGQGTACTETQTVPANQTRTFALAAFSLSVAGEN